MVLINMVVAPSSAPQTLAAQPAQPTPPPPRKLDPVDREIMAILRRAGRYGLPVWQLLDETAYSQNPSSRAERRALRVAAWSRLRRLLRDGMAHWFGRKNITATKLPRMSVRRRWSFCLGSTIAESPSPREQAQPKEFCTNWIMKGPSQLAPAGSAQETESAKAMTAPGSPQPRHTDEIRQVEVRSAAQSLARLPRGVKRKLSGFAGTTRLWRGRPVLVAGSTPAYALGARRQKVVFCLDPSLALERGRWGVVPGSAVRIRKNESASALGRAKRGRVERKSELKARTSRANGAMPCGPGKRRGRPRRGPMPVF
jgi:hypothetical protein